MCALYRNVVHVHVYQSIKIKLVVMFVFCDKGALRAEYQSRKDVGIDKKVDQAS